MNGFIVFVSSSSLIISCGSTAAEAQARAEELLGEEGLLELSADIVVTPATERLMCKVQSYVSDAATRWHVRGSVADLVA